MRWLRAFTHPPQETGFERTEFTRIAVGADGSLFVGGITNSPFTLSSGVVITATTDAPAHFVAAFDAKGTYRWHRAWMDRSYTSALRLTPDGNVLVSGARGSTVSNESTIFVEELSPAGVPIWRFEPESTTPGAQVGLDVMASPDGTVIASGVFTGAVTFGPYALPLPGQYRKGMWIAKLRR